ncbi:hypothetical protein C0993_002417, partial [Termitomyces sp. T159_Od127]
EAVRALVSRHDPMSSSTGIETVAHVRENRRITILFNAFEGPPRICRIYARGPPVLPPLAPLTRPQAPSTSLAPPNTNVSSRCTNAGPAPALQSSSTSSKSPPYALPPSLSCPSLSRT